MTQKIRILILEDNIQQAASIKEALENLGYEVTAVANNLKDALGYFYSQKPDMVIIDIFLNGAPEGIEFAERINENFRSVKPFVFLTSSVDRLTFEKARLTGPYSYLIKPFNILEIQFAIELAIERFANAPGIFSIHQKNGVLVDNFFFIRKKEAFVKVVFESIEYIEVEGKYVTIIANQESYLLEMSLKQLSQKLPNNLFFQIHRNYIVNMQMITKLDLEYTQLVLKSGKAIPVSRRFKDKFIENYSL